MYPDLLDTLFIEFVTKASLKPEEKELLQNFLNFAKDFVKHRGIRMHIVGYVEAARNYGIVTHEEIYTIGY
jgi:hypothetical protein